MKNVISNIDTLALETPIRFTSDFDLEPICINCPKKPEEDHVNGVCSDSFLSGYEEEIIETLEELSGKSREEFTIEDLQSEAIWVKGRRQIIGSLAK